jgi:hypothetical protein
MLMDILRGYVVKYLSTLRKWKNGIGEMAKTRIFFGKLMLLHV